MSLVYVSCRRFKVTKKGCAEDRMGLGGGYAASLGANKVSADKHDVFLSMGV